MIYVTSSPSPKDDWIRDLYAGPPSKESLARLVDEDRANDPAEVQYYEEASDPQFVLLETEQRRYAAQYRRRIRHLDSKHRSD